MGEHKAKSLNAMSEATKPDETVCAGHALGFPLRSTLGFQPIEGATLDVFRCICDLYATASAQAWELAMRVADEQLGSIDGPLLVARVTALMRALRWERSIGFSYLSAGCHHVSPDELTVTGLLRSARRSDAAGVERGIALALNNSAIADRTRSAVKGLAELQSRYAEQSVGGEQLENETVQAIYLH